MKDFNIVQITTHLTYFVVHASVRINLDNNGVFVNLYIYNYNSLVYVSNTKHNKLLI